MSEKNLTAELEETVKIAKDYIAGLDSAIRTDGKIIVSNYENEDLMPGWDSRATMKPDAERDVRKSQEEFENLYNRIYDVAKKISLLETEEIKQAEDYDFTTEEKETFEKYIKNIDEYDYELDKSRYPEYPNGFDFNTSIRELFHILIAFELMDRKELDENIDVFTYQLAQNVYIAQNAIAYEGYDPCKEYSYPSIEETVKELAKQSAEGCVRYKMNYWVGKGDDAYRELKDVEHKVRRVEADEIEGFVKMVTEFADAVPVLAEPFLENYDDFREDKGLDFELDYFAKSLGFELSFDNPAANDIEFYKYKIACLMFVREFGVE